MPGRASHVCVDSLHMPSTHWPSNVEQSIGVPVQRAEKQASALVQLSPSLHTVPLATGCELQPKVGWQVSVVQTLPSLQLCV